MEEQSATPAQEAEPVTMPAPGTVRPSNLPKFARCRCYDSKPGASDAARRGTLVDAAIRQALITGTVQDAVDGLDADAMEAVKWGVAKVLELAHGAPVLADEADLRVNLHDEVDPDIFPAGTYGTMDALIPMENTLIDYKTGIIRNYKEQMAAYALALMTRSQNDLFMDPVDRYTAHLVFVDQQEVVTHHFTMEEAAQCVRDAVNRPLIPTGCEYCTWCRHFDTCPAVRQDVASACSLAADLPQPTPNALSLVTKNGDGLPPVLAELADDHERAAEFLDQLDRVNEWAKKLKSVIAYKLDNGQTSTVFKYTNAKPVQRIMPLMLGRYMPQWGTDAILGMFDHITMSKFLPVWQKFEGDKPIPDALICEKPGTRQLRRTSTKTPKSKKP